MASNGKSLRVVCGASHVVGQMADMCCGIMVSGDWSGSRRIIGEICRACHTVSSLMSMPHSRWKSREHAFWLQRHLMDNEHVCEPCAQVCDDKEYYIYGTTFVAKWIFIQQTVLRTTATNSPKDHGLITEIPLSPMMTRMLHPNHSIACHCGRLQLHQRTARPADSQTTSHVTSHLQITAVNKVCNSGAKQFNKPSKTMAISRRRAVSRQPCQSYPSRSMMSSIYQTTR